MMFKLTYVPTLRNTLLVKSCVFVRSADSIEELIAEHYSIPDPLNWMLESVQEL
jgi:hypothetical protein